MLWSWALSAIGITGLWLAGSRRHWGWLVNAGSQVVWATYAVVTDQWGFIPACIAYSVVYIRNFRAAKR